MDDRKRKKRDVEVSREVSTNDFQTNSLQGNHVRDLIKDNIEDMISETKTNESDVNKERNYQKK
ncbi:hypothetical protein RJG79_07165 [Mycoplasmatota bacterium WC44]